MYSRIVVGTGTRGKSVKITLNIFAVYIPHITKGQIISKCLFGVIIWTKKNNEIFSRISALASKERSNQKNEGTLLY